MCNSFFSVSFVVFTQVGIFPLYICDILIYVARWWEKLLSKSSLNKYTCSSCDKLIILWTLNRQAKIFLRISNINTFRCLYLIKFFALPRSHWHFAFILLVGRSTFLHGRSRLSFSRNLDIFAMNLLWMTVKNSDFDCIL